MGRTNQMEYAWLEWKPSVSYAEQGVLWNFFFMYLSVCSGSQHKVYGFAIGHARKVSYMLLAKVVSLSSGFWGSISTWDVLKSKWEWKRLDRGSMSALPLRSLRKLFFHFVPLLPHLWSWGWEHMMVGVCVLSNLGSNENEKLIKSRHSTLQIVKSMSSRFALVIAKQVNLKNQVTV